MSDLSIFKLDSQTITIKDTTARQTAESAKTLATAASTAGNAVREQITELKNDLDDICVISENLYDPQTDTIGKNINESGEVIDSNTLKISDYIDIGINTAFTLKTEETYGDGKGACLIAQYDENKNFISRRQVTSESGYLTLRLSTSKYIRIIMKADTSPYMVNLGDSLLPYVPYGYVGIKESVNIPIIDNLDTKVDNLDAKVNNLDAKVNNLIDVSPDIYNPDSDTIGLISQDGTINPSESWKYSELIYIGLGNTVCAKTATSYHGTEGATFVAYYDENGDFISREQVSERTTYHHTMVLSQVYIRVIANVNASPYMVNLGDSLLPYVPYGYVYSENLSDYINQQIDEGFESDLNANMDHIFSTANGGNVFRWSSAILPSEVTIKSNLYDAIDGTGDYSGSTTLAELYAEWDELAESYPDYITKSDLGTDQSGQYHIYQYSFVPETIDVKNDTFSLVGSPKIILCGGQHGNGTDAGDQPEMLFSTLYLFKAICNNWIDDEFLAYLRWHVHFEIIPVINPWGYENKSRRNSRQVDINRNFPVGWRSGTQGANDYGGTAPLTEAESVILKNFIDENTDAIMFTNLHTTGGIQAQERLIYFAMLGSDEMAYVANDLVIQMSKTWKNDTSLSLDRTLNFFGFISDSSDGSGETAAYAHSLGIPSCVIEGFPNYINSSTTVGSKTIMGMVINELANFILRSLSYFKDTKRYYGD